MERPFHTGHVFRMLVCVTVRGRSQRLVGMVGMEIQEPSDWRQTDRETDGQSRPDGAGSHTDARKMGGITR